MKLSSVANHREKKRAHKHDDTGARGSFPEPHPTPPFPKIRMNILSTGENFALKNDLKKDFCTGILYQPFFLPLLHLSKCYRTTVYFIPQGPPKVSASTKGVLNINAIIKYST